jgi:hypothetical protein
MGGHSLDLWGEYACSDICRARNISAYGTYGTGVGRQLAFGLMYGGRWGHGVIAYCRGNVPNRTRVLGGKTVFLLG